MNEDLRVLAGALLRKVYLDRNGIVGEQPSVDQKSGGADHQTEA